MCTTKFDLPRWVTRALSGDWTKKRTWSPCPDTGAVPVSGASRSRPPTVNVHEPFAVIWKRETSPGWSTPIQRRPEYFPIVLTSRSPVSDLRMTLPEHFGHSNDTIPNSTAATRSTTSLPLPLKVCGAVRVGVGVGRADVAGAEATAACGGRVVGGAAVVAAVAAGRGVGRSKAATVRRSATRATTPAMIAGPCHDLFGGGVFRWLGVTWP